jgi:hypothetical protein
LTKAQGQTLEALGLMAEAEGAVGEFYRACADLSPMDRSFWLRMAGEEDAHRKSIQTIADMISRSPEKFSPGRPFTPPAARTFLSFVRRYTAGLRKEEIPREKLFFIARDLERSLLEFSFFEIVTSADPGFQNIVKEISAQTAEHKIRLEKRIAENPSGI